MPWTPSFEWDVEDWRLDAACRTVDAQLFFPTGTTGEARSQIDAAKAFCQACSVRSACLEFALESNQEAGVWGGTDEEERRRLRRRWRAGRGTRRSAVSV